MFGTGGTYCRGYSCVSIGVQQCLSSSWYLAVVDCYLACAALVSPAAFPFVGTVVLILFCVLIVAAVSCQQILLGSELGRDRTDLVAVTWCFLGSAQ